MDASMQQADTGGSDTSMTQDVTVNDAPMVKDVTTDTPIIIADSPIQCGPTLTCPAKTSICCDHSFSTTWQCVTNASACAGAGDVPIACSSHDNCVSQGTPGDICCGNTMDNGACEVATSVSCMATCQQSANQVQIGCGTMDPCPTDAPNCRVSTCTLPGYDFCSE
jgi:hypothetical protein